MFGIKIHSLFVYTFCTEDENDVTSYTLELRVKTYKTKNKNSQNKVNSYLYLSRCILELIYKPVIPIFN